MAEVQRPCETEEASGGCAVRSVREAHLTALHGLACRQVRDQPGGRCRWRRLEVPVGGGRPQVASGRLLLRAARRERRGARRGVLLRRRRLWLARGRGARPGRTAARDHGPRLLVPLFHHAARVQPVPRLLRVPRLDGGPFAARLLVCTGAPARKLLRRARGPQLGRPCVGPRLASRRAERRPLLRARRRCFASRSAVRLRAAHLHASRCEEQAARAARSARRAARRRRRARQPPSSSRRRWRTSWPRLAAERRASRRRAPRASRAQTTSRAGTAPSARAGGEGPSRRRRRCR